MDESSARHAEGPARPKVPLSAHVLCGWPLLLVALGGLIGGALGGAAYAVNMGVYQSELPVPAKVILNLFVGFLAFGIWLALGIALTLWMG
jgi:hypothetical protein